MPGALGRLRRTVSTIRHLRPGQVGHRLLRVCRRVHAEPGPPPPLRPRASVVVEPASRDPILLAPDEFTMLGQRGRIAGPADWNDLSRDKLWLYHCHYFEDLVASEWERRRDWHRGLIARWIAENPPGLGNGWEPYPLSLRISHWILWDWMGGGLDEAARRSLAVQVRWLRRSIEWHILANHVIANLKAMVLAGCWAAGEEGDHWLRYGLEALEAQVAEQVLPDGGHIERSPMYHCQVLNDLLDVVNGLRVAGLALPEWLLRTVASMGAWLAVMRHPDGDIPLFNDCAFGMAPHPDALAEYGMRLGLAWSMKAPQEGVWLADTGYARLCLGEAVVFCDGAALGPDWQPGHGHADTLTWEASLGGQRVVVDPGTSMYGGGPERLRQRSTVAHNTLCVDGRDSSEVWAGFRVGRRARVIEAGLGADGLSFYASHDGYRRHGVVHRRDWRLVERGVLVEDRLEGRGSHDCEGSLLFHPELLVEANPDGGVRCRHRTRGNVLCRVVPPAGSTIVAGGYHPRFGVSQGCSHLRFVATVALPASFRWGLSW